VGGLLTEKLRDAVLMVLGMVVMVLGVEMVIDWHDPLQVIISLVLGALVGEKIDIEAGLEALGQRLQDFAGRWLAGDLAKGFVYATLIYCVGPMAILGSLQSGVQGVHSILLAKAAIDGLTAIAFASTLGVGVMFSALPVFLYQGSLTLAAVSVGGFLASVESATPQLTATGGILIVGLGLKILNVRQIRVANLLPALPLSVFFAWLTAYIGG